MSYSSSYIWVHAILGVKYRVDLIPPEKEPIIYDLIKNEFSKLNCPVKIINGIGNHIHVLFLLNRNKSIAEVMKQVKGATFFHINKKEIIDQQFKWQVGYGAFSISDSAVPRVTKYIANQKPHHAP